MKRSELIERLTCRVGQVSEKDSDLAVRAILQALTESLATGGRIEIRGFGSFHVKERAARTGRNPRSGATVWVPPKYVPHFKPGKVLRERVEATATPQVIKRAA